MKVTLQIEIDNIDVAEDILVLAKILDGKANADILSPVLLLGLPLALHKLGYFIEASAKNHIKLRNGDTEIYRTMSDYDSWEYVFQKFDSIREEFIKHNPSFCLQYAED
jgi:hypothetical protein